ncbi:MAG: ParA family protein [Prevotellaceae bacterium]|jgi:cellulose biosynthesis protein BcsQ|nr:ParA family protein [Prevotellaceae bacterium]
MKILSFANQKGGEGKSALTKLTAGALSMAPFNLKVLVIDADTQGSIIAHRNRDIATLGEDYEFPYKVEFSFPEKLPKLITTIKQQGKYDVVLIDMPGRGYGDDINVLLSCLDIAIIPIAKGDEDTDASLDFLENLKQHNDERKKAKYPKLNLYILYNKFDNTANAKASVEIFEAIKEEFGIEEKILFLPLREDFQNYSPKTSTSILLELKGKQGHKKDTYESFIEFCKFIKKII